MIFHRARPTSVLYDDLRTYGGITNKEAASVLLSARIMAGGKSPRDRIVESRTYLSRKVVNVAPGDINPAMYGDFYASTQSLYARVRNHVGGRGSMDMVLKHYAGPATDAMEAALRAHGIESQVYRNEVERLLRVHVLSEQDRPLLLFMLFCITGCLADTSRAVRMVEEFAKHRFARDLTTISTLTESNGETEPVSLALLRVRDGVAQPPFIPLSPQGNVIGAHAAGPGAISNVEPDVSRSHLHIWCEDGRWLCEGMDSTNGTFLISGADGSVLCVEPPRKERSPKALYPPMEFHAGDTLCCGANTQFFVTRIYTHQTS